MKIKVILWILIFLSASLNAAKVSPETAQQIGSKYFSQVCSATTNQPSIIAFPIDRTEPDFYILRFLPRGFVVVAADDRSVPILAYSATTDIAIDPPPHVAWFLRQYSRSIHQIRQHPEWAVNSEWTTLRQGTLPVTPMRSVEPLLSTKWNQDWPYNSGCPLDPDGPGGHAYTGAVATAMGQILKYWGHPNSGSGAHSYNSPLYGTQSADFGATAYHWSAMPDSLTEENPSVGTLLYHCGVSVNMDYGAEVSNASSAMVRDALVMYFGYRNTALHYYGNYYSTAQWTNLLQTNLDQMRPIYYCGQNAEASHAFVMDGYQGTNYFHINWGWSGTYDGYYYVSNLHPGTDSFIQNQAAVMNICPVIPQLNTLCGTIRNLEGLPLENAVVTLEETNLSASTDSNGHYSITSIPVGTYQAVAAKCGCQSVTMNIEIVADQQTVQDYILPELMAVVNDDTLAPLPIVTACYPNPFRQDIWISLNIAKDSDPVTIDIYDLRGRKVQTLHPDSPKSGSHNLRWDGLDLHGSKTSSGLYLCRISSGNRTQTLKMIRIN